MVKHPIAQLVAGIALVAITISARAQNVEISDAWARPTVPGQTASGAYMSIRSEKEAKIVGATTPVAAVAQVHRMVMRGTMMSMQAVPVLELPPGKTVTLRPNGLHVMLFDLKKPLSVGEHFPLTFRIAVGAHRVIEQTVETEVRPFEPAAK